jgi:hypothetical protein
MKPAVRPALIGVLVAALLLGGCGIPDDTAVVPVGPAPSRGVSPGDDVTPTKSQRGDTNDKATFVLNYLAAAAGDYDSATDQVKQFMSPAAAADFKASTDIKVVRVKGSPVINPNSPVVSIGVRVVGTLDSLGKLTPASDYSVKNYDLTIGAADGQTGWFVTKAPNFLLLSDSALSAFYTKRTIYFWNFGRTGLVPDVRYMPLSVPTEQQPTEVLNWLTNGPAPWLAGIADPLPTGTKLIGNVPAVSNGTLQISLSSQALPVDDASAALDRLQKQLRWSLRPNLGVTLELAIEHQPEHTYRGTDYLPSNAAYKATTEPERFVVYDGQVRRLSRSYNSSAPVPVLQSAANRNVRSAAFSASGNRTYAALVVDESNGTQALRAGSALNGQEAALRRIPLPKPIGRPVWAVTPDAESTVGLVVAKGRLYSFTTDSSRAAEVSGAPGGLSAVAVAPDALRIAFISGGRLYLTTLNDDNGVQVSEPILINTVLTDLTAVDWSGEGTLVVSGVNPDTGRVAIMDVSIDGASQTDRLGDLGVNKVTFLTAFPANPSRSQDLGVPVAYELNGAAYDELSSERIDVRDLAESVASPRAGIQPTSPFFLD